jgi:hypothetical protein
MTPSTHNLTPKQERAIIALLSNRSVEEAAKAWIRRFEPCSAGSRNASSTPLIGWRNGPPSGRPSRLHYFTSAAVTTLGKVMLDPATPPATRVRAADSVLNHTIKVVEEEDIEARVAELEKSADENKPSWRGRSNQWPRTCRAKKRRQCNETILEECGYLRDIGGASVVMLADIPDGLDAKETVRFLRERGAELCT